MAGSSIKVEGLAELERALRALPKEISGAGARGPLYRALARATRIMVDEAKMLAPVDTARMVKAVYRRRGPTDGRGKETVLITVRKGKSREDPKGAFYFHFQELGAPNRNIRAQPFLRPAFDHKKAETALQFKLELRAEIDKAARKVAGKGGKRGR